ncbi:MAG: putative lipoprotein [Labilithrix sp.]|nr:putative lipoprotein [Labilithrix sp.]
MMTRTGLVVCAVVAAASLVSVATTACGGSDDGSGFSSGGTSGGTSGTSGGASGTSGSILGSTGGTSGTDSGQKVDECKKMDIIFTVDDSGSMSQEQANLAANFPKFVKVINDYKTKGGEQLDYRLAVTSTDTDKEKGAFNATKAAGAPGGCTAGPARPWLERADGDVAGAFGCRAQYGTKGSNIERPLESTLLGVTARIADGTNTANGASFLREDALLAFVIITDEDEGGTENEPARAVTEYPKELDKVKGERGRWASAVIAGEKACSSPGLGQAAEAKRLKGFITDVGKNGVFSSICTGDLTDGLTQALAKFDQACREFPSGPVK